MTCRIEMYYANPPLPIPYSCPDCGLGPCKHGLKLVSLPAGFNIERPTGQVDTFDAKGNCVGSRGPVGTTGHNLPTQEQLDAELAENQWQLKQAANPKAVATGDRGLPSGDKLRGSPKLVRVIATDRRLKLIGYLVDNFDQRGQYTIHDLDGMVDKIAAILLDD